MFSVDDEKQGGLLQMNEQWGDMASHWSIYLRVTDVDATVAKAQSLGGSVCVPAFDAPGVGRIAMIGDPTGGYAYLIALSADR
jgi:predicted enzyme related to lactoylglutathione lyase